MWADFLAPVCEEMERRNEQRTREILAQMLAEKEAATASSEKNEELLNKRQAAELLGIRPKTVDLWKGRGLLPHHR